jgi:hypothetical protein
MLGLVLAIGQFASIGHTSGDVRTCACCSCARLNCCATPVFPTPLSTPASSQSNEQRVEAPALIVVAVLATPSALPLVHYFASSEDFLLNQTAVPIYERNCSYLI